MRHYIIYSLLILYYQQIGRNENYPSHFKLKISWHVLLFYVLYVIWDSTRACQIGWLRKKHQFNQLWHTEFEIPKLLKCFVQGIDLAKYQGIIHIIRMIKQADGKILCEASSEMQYQPVAKMHLQSPNAAEMTLWIYLKIDECSFPETLHLL